MLEHSKRLELISYLLNFISPQRKQRFDEVIKERTSHVCVVLEDLFQGHNASAVLRSCDCFGIQNVHFIENKNNMKVNDEIALGSSNWLSLHHHNSEKENTIPALRKLKEEGYRIVVTTPHEHDQTIDQLSIDTKMALVFGTEIHGISEEAKSVADEFVKIPMYGFTESFNISVSAALCLYELKGRLKRSAIPCQLSEEETSRIYLDWVKKSIETGDLLVREWMKRNSMT